MKPFLEFLLNNIKIDTKVNKHKWKNEHNFLKITKFPFYESHILIF